MSSNLDIVLVLHKTPIIYQLLHEIYEILKYKYLIQLKGEQGRLQEVETQQVTLHYCDKTKHHCFLCSKNLIIIFLENS